MEERAECYLYIITYITLHILYLFSLIMAPVRQKICVLYVEKSTSSLDPKGASYIYLESVVQPPRHHGVHIISTPLQGNQHKTFASALLFLQNHAKPNFFKKCDREKKCPGVRSQTKTA
jgi:hypothetical protein